MPATPIRAVVAEARRFLDWWLGELIALLPERLRIAVSGRPPLVVLLGANGLRLDNPASGAAEERNSLPGDFAGAEELRRLAEGGSAARLAVPEPLCFLRTTTLPAAALRRAGEILALELERSTPLRREQVCCGWSPLNVPQSGNNKTVAHAVVKRTTIGPALKDLFRAGFADVQVVCRHPDGIEIPVELPAELRPPASRTLRFVSIANRINLCVAGAALCGAILVAFAQERGLLADLEREITTTQAAAAAVRASYDAARGSAETANSLKSRRGATPRLTEVLDELTRRLPDTAWITEVRTEGSQASITGFAKSAAELIPALEGSDLFANPQFISPVVRSPREGGDRFEISVELSGPPLPATDQRT